MVWIGPGWEAHGSVSCVCVVFSEMFFFINIQFIVTSLVAGLSTYLKSTFKSCWVHRACLSPVVINSMQE
jgi:hypothetical protein